MPEIPNVRVFQLDNKNNNKLNPIRARISVACSNCRAKKIKCSGTHPCLYCTVYSLNCVYVPRSTRKRANSIVKHEHEGKSQLSSFGVLSSTPELTSLARVKKNEDKDFYKDILKQLYPNYHFPCTKDLHNKKKIIDDLKSQLALMSPEVDDKSSTTAEFTIELPPKEWALKLVTKTWNFACMLFRFYHRPSFLATLNSLYECEPSDYTNEQYRTLPLVYSVLACGALFCKEDSKSLEEQHIQQDEAYKYFKAASKLIDMANVTDIKSIQAIYMLTLFLQNSAKLATSYSYIGTALRAVIRKGFHKRSVFDGKLGESPLEFETRKRLFWTIYKTEIYMNCMLGLPTSLQEKDVSQDFPIDVDDENLFDDRILLQDDGKISSCGMNNEHTKIILILNHVKENFYSLNNDPLHPSLQKVYLIESEINKWMLELPEHLNPYAVNIPPEYLPANKLLHLDYLHVLISLYKPFLPYILHPEQREEHFMATKCINSCRSVIGVSKYMLENTLINGSYWFSQHTIFFAIACLMHLKKIKPESPEIENDRMVGMDILYKLKDSNQASAHIFSELAKNFNLLDLKREACVPEKDTQIKLESIGDLKISDLLKAQNICDPNLNPATPSFFSTPANDVVVSQHPQSLKENNDNFLPEFQEPGLEYMYMNGIFDQWPDAGV
ncbi:hypothetical protein ACO0RG_001748 [Hanseniaspora osmophila]